MNKSVLRLKRVVLETKNINCCRKALNLDINSFFLCLLGIIEDAITDYDQTTDYTYLEKISEYLEKTYEKLTKNDKQFYLKQIIIIRKMCKKLLNTLNKKQKECFENLYRDLGLLLLNKQKEVVNLEKINDNLYDLLSETIFNFKSLEYLDKLIEKNPNILNTMKDSKNVLMLVIDEYIKQIACDDEELIAYYERVINKFLLEETFDLTDQMRDYIIKSLETFVNNKHNLRSRVVKEIKNIIEIIDKKTNIYNILNINILDKELTPEELSLINIDFRKFKSRELVTDYIITIDDEDSLCLDDGISFEKLRNGNTLFKVHISDPLAIFPYYSKIIQDAKKQASTIYHNTKSLHMLPTVLACDKLSLKQGEDRLAKTFCFEFDKSFNLVNFFVLNTIVNVSERLSYDKLNALYQKGGMTKEEDEVLIYYNDLVNALKKSFKNAKIYETVKPSSAVGYAPKMGSFSENLVAYSMILTGHYMAKYFYEHNLPYAYRCHKFDLEWLNLLSDYINNPDNQVYKDMLKSLKGNLPKSYYSEENQGHMGLKIDSYSHITSPLRRFCDVLNMLCLDTCYFKRPNDKEIYELEEEIKKTCEYLNMQNNTIDEYVKKGLRLTKND